jgi:hypothetical protein
MQTPLPCLLGLMFSTGQSHVYADTRGRHDGKSPVLHVLQILS